MKKILGIVAGIVGIISVIVGVALKMNNNSWGWAGIINDAEGGGNDRPIQTEVKNFYISNTLRGSDRKSTRLNSSHSRASRMPSSA